MANKTKKGGLKSAQTQETIEEVVETVKIIQVAISTQPWTETIRLIC